ncbi:MAG: cbb3-type cytochrome oxidase subunit 3 [Rhodocyclaceae bacterium]|nr:cbb3-type cytochrome oxidase subunit 3 [Rhodocyclaceae bacterium]MBX3668317.1 cbb3-type cytochrome oxidase subunit 3 [Rhodocyclaceae bacterium]
MDVSLIRSVVTVFSLLCFLGIVYWAYSAKNRKLFEDAGRIPLEEDDLPEASSGPNRDQGK